MVEAVYKPRKPKASPLYQSISEHFSEFESVYEERYQNKFGVLPDVVREVVYKYLGGGDLRKGFARIKCKDCKHEVLLAFSCKGRYFCSSCPIIQPARIRLMEPGFSYSRRDPKSKFLSFVLWWLSNGESSNTRGF